MADNVDVLLAIEAICKKFDTLKEAWCQGTETGTELSLWVWVHTQATQTTVEDSSLQVLCWY